MSAAAILWVLVATLLVLVAGLVLWVYWRPAEDPFEEIRTEVPDSLGAWRAEGAPVVYDRESIFDYIDGHAEVYLAYGMRRTLARRYSGPQGEPDLVLDIFEMASPSDAFGVFTYDLEGNRAGIGIASRLRYGWLSFWQDRYFVSVLAEEETEAAEEAVLELGRKISRRLPPGGELPELVRILPPDGRLENRVRFLRDPQILATHLSVDASLFRLDRGARAALAAYRREGASAEVLLVRYRRNSTAREVRAAFRDHFLGDRGDGPGRGPDDAWYGVRVVHGYLVAVVGGSDGDVVSGLLAEVLAGLEQGGR